MKLHIGSLFAVALLAAGCSQDSGGGGTSSATPAAAGGPACQYNAPSTDLTAIPASEVPDFISDLQQTIFTGDNRFVVPYIVAVTGDFKLGIWNGTKWNVETVDTGYTSLLLSLPVFDLGSSLGAIIQGASATLSNGVRFYTESGISFGPPVNMLGVPPIDFAPFNSVNGSGQVCGTLVSPGPFSQITFTENISAGTFSNWQIQLVDSSTTANFQGASCGYFADGTPFVAAVLQSPGTASLLFYNRVGTVWSKVDTISSADLISNIKVAINTGGQQALLMWDESFLGSGSILPEDDGQATLIDLKSKSVAPPTLVKQLVSPIFAGDLFFTADFSAAGSKGVYAVQALGEGQIWSGDITGSGFTAPTPYHPEIGWTSTSIKVRRLACDQFVFVGEKAFTDFFSELMPSP